MSQEANAFGKAGRYADVRRDTYRCWLLVTVYKPKTRLVMDTQELILGSKCLSQRWW